jgi:hypothetical protein
MNVESTSINSVDNSLPFPIVKDNEPLNDEDTASFLDASENELAREAEAVPETDLPEPDRDNITVFTNKLPNKPILPWNHYDSPWHEEENKAETMSKDERNPTESDKVE